LGKRRGCNERTSEQIISSVGFQKEEENRLNSGFKTEEEVKVE
jgi:hypothetical protein